MFSTPVIFKATSKLFGSQGCSDDKNWLDFSCIFFKICRFCSSIPGFRCIQRGATLESGLTVARLFSTNHNSLLRIATNEIASFCMDHRSRRSRQMAFFSCKGGTAGPKAGFRVILKYFEIKKAFRYYIKQIDSMLPCVWFSNRSQKTSKCGKNKKVAHEA